MRRLLNWLGIRRETLENDLDRELRYHVDRRVDDLVKSGVSEREARRQTSMELGGVTQVQEEVRDAWLIRWLREFVYDLKFAARSFVRSPSFTATAALSLALGIGATTAIYSLVDQVLLRQLPVREPERLVLIDWIGEQLAFGMGSGNLMSYPMCRDLQLQDRFFDGVICRHPTTANLSTGSDPKPAPIEIVSGTYFSVLGVRSALGRLFDNDDDRIPGAHPVVVLSHDFWTQQLAASPDVIGRKVLINNHPMTVIGVAVAGFRGVDIGEVPSLWIPAAMKAQATPAWDRLLDRRARWMHVFGRLKPGISIEQAQAGLQPWFKSLLDEDTRIEGFPKATSEQRQRFLSSSLELTAAPQGRSGLRARLTQPLRFLFAATAVLLTLACLNVAGLFLARGSAREREITTRMALGASRNRIGRQLIADSIVIAFAGGLLGLLVAPVVARSLIAFLPSDAATIDLRPGVDARLLIFSFLVSATAGIVSGLVPALKAGRGSLTTSLRERAGTQFGGVRLRKLIVTFQIAFTLVLVIGAALFVQTLVGLLAKGPGFATSSLVTFGLDSLRNGYSGKDGTRLIRRLHEEFRALRSAQGVALSSNQLLSGGSWNMGLTVQTNERKITESMVHLNAISPEFFSTLGIRIAAGRDFDDRDARPPEDGGFRSAIVNQSFVRRYLGKRDPLGARVGFGTGPDTRAGIEIVGVVADFSYRGLREEVEQAYFPLFESASPAGHFYLRVRGTPESAFQSVRAIVQNADPTLPISNFRTLDEQINRSLNTERMLATVSGGFGALALLLSLVGLYGVMSFVVTQRTREIGVRLALGATRASAIWLVLRDALSMILAGTAIALPCIWALGRLVESQLFSVKPTDPVTIGAAALLLAGAALGAALVPAYRASTVNPTDALRFE